MYFDSVTVTNFKSFDKMTVNFRNLNYIIGSNASGKSNFISVLKFIKNISVFGLNNAVSMEGGIEYLRNRRISNSKNTSFSLRYKPGKISHQSQKDNIIIDVDNDEYFFSLRSNKSNNRFRITADKLFLNFKAYSYEGDKNKISEKHFIGDIKYTITVNHRKFAIKVDAPPAIDKKTLGHLVPEFLKGFPVPTGHLILGSPVFELLHPALHNKTIQTLSIYDFDPKQPKKAVSITGKTELEENGSNLSIVLKNIIEQKDKKRKFINLIKDLLPFVDDLNVQKTADKSLLFSINEKYGEYKDSLPAAFISDGTVNITSLLVALYFEGNAPQVIEEPERNIHPHLISKIVSMFEEVSENKQLFVTSHNPEIVRHAQIDDLLLITRNNEGFSTISRPKDNSHVKFFLENDMGIDELYVQNLIG